MKRIIQGILLTSISLVIFLGGFWWGKNSIPSSLLIPEVYNKRGEERVDFGIFWDAWKIIKTRYLKASELDKKDMVYGAIKGLVDSLDDPYSEFLEPEISKRFLENIRGSFEGIGAEIGMKDNALTVIAPLEGTPAQRAGLRSGDRIIKIDGQITTDLTLEEAVNLIRGPKGTQVTLTILREENDSEPLEIKITRGVIKIPVINWELKDQGRIAYVRLYSFTESAANDFSNVANKILKSSAQKIILDLRDNPGGYLETAVDIAGWFVEPGKIVVIEKRGEGDLENYRSHGKAFFKSWPVVVLINKGSASASEILAGALRDLQGAKLIGQVTFGKGSVQEMEKLEKNAFIKLTVAEWLTPKGISINKNGLSPDIEVDLTKEDLNAGEDPQLAKALEYLRDL